MASPLANALASDEYAELDNPLMGGRSSWRDEMEPDYETEPDEVTLGEDGNYYANDNRWNYGEWVTYVGDEPVYWVEGGAERDTVDSDQWQYDEFGNVVTKDADLVANGKALNPNGQWMTEQQIRDRWDAPNGMSNFRKANPNMSVDDYIGLMKESTALKAQGIERLGEGGISPEYQALYDKYGLETSYTGSDGAVYEWNGGGYTITQNGVDMGSQILHSAVLGIIGAGLTAGLAGALTPALGASGAKAAASGITSLTQDLLQGGDLDFKAALLSAGMSYLGEEFQDLLSGVADDAVGAAENSDLMKTIQGYVDAGYSEETINKMYEVLQGGLDAGAQSNQIIDAINQFMDTGVVEVVWDIIDATDKEGEFNPDADSNPYDPSLIDPQLPEVVDPNNEGGGGGSTEGGDSGGNTGGDAGSDTDSAGNPDWRYENGVWTNGTDTIVGPGSEGDTMTDEEMAGAWETGDYTWGGINPDGGWGDTGTGGSGDADVSDQPDGTPCSIGGKGGVVVNGVCVIANIPNPNPNPNSNPDPDTPAEGDACTTADGASGTIKDGVCVVNSTGGTGTGVNVGGNQDGNPTLPDGNGNGNGGGNGDGNGDGDGDGNGDGDGDGDGDGSGNGNGMFAGVTGTGANSPPTWGPLLKGYQFTPRPKTGPTIGQRLFADLFEGR